MIIVAAGHDTLAKLIYAWNLPVGGGPIASRHTGAELMYYGGSVIEVALAAVVMAQWYQRETYTSNPFPPRRFLGHGHPRWPDRRLPARLPYTETPSPDSPTCNPFRSEASIRLPT